MRLNSANFRFGNMFGRKIRRKPALRSRILFASTELVHRPRSDSPLPFDIENTYQIRTGKSNASARRLLPATLLERWPQVCRVKITFESISGTQLVRFHINKFDEMLCNLDSSEYARSFKQNLTWALP